MKRRSKKIGIRAFDRDHDADANNRYKKFILRRRLAKINELPLSQILVLDAFVFDSQTIDTETVWEGMLKCIKRSTCQSAIKSLVRKGLVIDANPWTRATLWQRSPLGTAYAKENIPGFRIRHDRNRMNWRSDCE